MMFYSVCSYINSKTAIATQLEPYAYVFSDKVNATLPTTIIILMIIRIINILVIRYQQFKLMIIKKIISAHEHLGYGRLVFSSDNWTDYDASPELLEADLAKLYFCTNCEKLGCIVYPQMPYRQYSFSKDYDITTALINEMFYKNISMLQSKIFYFPFIYLRCSDSLKYNEALIKKYRQKCYGLKVHPDAEQANPSILRKSGILDLANEYNLPITVHCSRPHGCFDYLAIKEELFEEIIRLGIRIDIAHMGFFEPSMFLDDLPANIFMDISPIGIILDQFHLSGGSNEAFYSSLTRFLIQNNNNVMYGEDFPYDVQKWEDGSIHGCDRNSNLSILKTALPWNKNQLIDQFFYKNCCRFLNIQDF